MVDFGVRNARIDHPTVNAKPVYLCAAFVRRNSFDLDLTTFFDGECVRIHCFEPSSTPYPSRLICWSGFSESSELSAAKAFKSERRSSSFGERASPRCALSIKVRSLLLKWNSSVPIFQALRLIA
ncbi:hypothetical protein Oant_1549 [Brucella anthropi ATCC 49188]|uniref:Uncharacterized protein n=1 Tax=Brucella anthropi (strain ATCC 49188 / DSM 6882 / CCUG 24695 / JCM 21032 / LMG 3331 / NBRC 15819 / NCTC 12168 / Alc 37) TaxID=439375 RepID=A6WZ61_BRUA4|nr:hypothetical protein Oant_1549 [Brucella anthropi ATCC 49188]